MSKYGIAVDIDDVIADTTYAVRNRVNEIFSASLREEHYRVQGEYWGYYERVWRQHGLNYTLAQIDEELALDQASVPLLAGAEYAIDQLLKKYRVILITSRKVELEAATKKWLHEHFGKSSPELYFSQSHYQDGAKNKGQLCVELGAQLLVDDNIEHCKTAKNEGVDSVLFGDYGWHYDIPSDLKRCKGWPEVLEYIDVWRS